MNTFHLAFLQASLVYLSSRIFTEPSVNTDAVEPVSGIAFMNALPIRTPRVFLSSTIFLADSVLGTMAVYKLDEVTPIFHCFISCLAIDRTSGVGSLTFCNFFEKRLHPGVPP